MDSMTLRIRPDRYRRPMRPTRPPSPSTTLPALLFSVLVLVAAACGGDDSASSDRGSASAPAVADTTDDGWTDGDAADDGTASDRAGGDVPEPPEGSESWSYPGADWGLEDPTDHGLDPAGLQALVDYAESTDSNCLVVVRDGALVAEHYWYDTGPESRQEVFSSSKSVTATLVGIAQDLGYLDIGQPASDFVEEWQGTDSEAVTIRNLLANDSGRHYDPVTDYLEMPVAEDRTAFAIALDQQHPIGEHWDYNNSAIQVLQAVLTRATGRSVNEFATEHLFEPIGMGSWFATDASGNEATFMGTQASCVDLARFGLLQLRDGWWDGTPVVSAEYAAEAVAPSQDLNTSYGYLWWLNGDDGGDWRFWADTPPDAYAAIGLGGQNVLVLPSQDMVVVRLGTFGGAGGNDDDGPPTVSTNELGRLAVAAVVD
jgi:CubicO group peptidase (beta-lactamase class C family)